MKKLFNSSKPLAKAVHDAIVMLMTGAVVNMPAAAQTQPAGDQGMLETITITATRRAEVTRDVPVAMFKISTDAQLDLGAKNLGDVLNTMPGLTYVKGSSPEGNGAGDIVMRGLSNGISNAATVGVYVDEVPIGGSGFHMGSSSAFDQRLLDLDNIEVLKGPQGTLYGASSMGGLLRYNTRSADFGQFSGRAGGEFSSTQEGGNNYTAYGHVNVPLSEGTAALRAAMFSSKDGGYVDAKGPSAGQDINSSTTNGARVALSFRPAQGLELRATLQTQDARNDGTDNVTADKYGNPKSGDLVRDPLRYPETGSRKNDLAVLNIEYDMGWAKAYSITGYQTQRTAQVQDQNDSGNPPTILLSTSGINTGLDKTTQEFRLVSKSGGVFEWLTGVFYTREKSTMRANVVATATAPSGPLPFGPAGTNLLNLGFDVNLQETAYYGTGVWNVSKDLALTAGFRASRISQDVNQLQFGVLPQMSGASGIKVGSASDTPDTYLLAARYKLTPASSLYARVASGYRAGGPNSLVPQYLTTTPPVSVPPYKPDTLWTYEVGYKADLPNKMGAFDVALFRTDWKDMQQTFTAPSGVLTTNAGSAQIQGIEFGGILRPIPALTLRGSLSIMNPKLTDAAPKVNGAAGERLPNSAKQSAKLEGRYSFSVTDKPCFVGANLSYTGDRTTGFFDNASVSGYYVLPAYTETDVTAGMTIGGFELGAYVRNVSNKRSQIWADPSLIPGNGPMYLAYTRPRTLGVTLSRDF